MSTPAASTTAAHPFDAATVLPGSVPVSMPALPPRLSITTAKQFQAFSDPLRSRILGIIQNQPATAKQLADRLGVAPGTIGHHLRALEAAGLAQVVARRMVRGIIARYYTRTARIFDFDLPPDVQGSDSVNVDFLTQARDELAEALAAGNGPAGGEVSLTGGLPHARLTPERAQHYVHRLTELMNEMMTEPVVAGSMVYGMSLSLYVAPPYLQVVPGDDDTPAAALPDTPR